MRRRTGSWGVLAWIALAACPPAPPAAGPALERLPRVAVEQGAPYAGQPRLAVKGRELVLPSGERCAGAAACAARLAPLAGQALALELAPELLMADLSEPFGALSAALGEEGLVCLLVSDGAGARCLTVRPFSGGRFSAWLDAPKPVGKLRVVMRADGLEVVTDAGKVPGPDRFGPSLPPVEGRPDLAGLERLASLLARRFPDETEAALAPSARTSVEQVVRALGVLGGPEQSRFATLDLVYP